MAAEHKVTQKGFSKQHQKLLRHNEIARRHAARAMSDSGKVVARLARQYAPGSLANKVNSMVEMKQDIIGRVTVNDYIARFVEFGTAPHGVSSEVLMEQMDVDAQSAFHISRSIAAKGTKGRFFLWRAWKRSQRAVNQYFERAIERITRELKV